MASSSRAQSEELLKIDDELTAIDNQLVELTRRKKKLKQRRQQLERCLADQSANGVNSDRWDSNSFPWSDKLEQTLRSTFKLAEFRELQRAAINAVLSGENVLLVMSTGSGKSLCYQLPAVIQEGLTLVVSPLVSLMEDQLMALTALGIHAAMLRQSTSKEELQRVQNAMTDSRSTLKLLYVTPEKLAKSKRFMARLEKTYEAGRLKCVAIDEVHCCSQWGHDFRPDYKFLNVLRRQFRTTPLMGLTATATASVVDDVKDMLGVPGAVVLRAGFNRANLFYEVRPKPQNKASLLEDLERLIRNRFPGQSGIIYCFTRKESEELAGELRKRGVRTGVYHADVDAQRKSEVHEKWTKNEYQVVVATVAFGMGIDKADVRFVVHHSMPKSMETYYQESGRAGRDGDPATCILYYRFADMFRQSTMVCVEKTGIDKLYPMLAYCTDETNCKRVLIAQHFEEPWEPSWCQNQCDACVRNTKNLQIKTLNITTQARSAIKLAREAALKKQRITGLKLAELLCKSDKNLKNLQAERILAHLLLEGYLKEDFHFTPYSIISYVVPGRKAELLNGDHVVSMVITRKKEPNSDFINQDKVPGAKKMKLTQKLECSQNAAVIDLSD